MKISIAMTTCNGENFLTHQLNSFISQSRLPDEVVICDDASSDNTLKLLKDFRESSPFEVRIHQNKTRLGLDRNFEKTLSLCNGDIIFLSDQDDIWYRDKVKIVSEYFASNPSVDIIINNADYAEAAAGKDLEISRVTVMEKALHYGGKDAHLAGACSALRRRYINFLIPFPTSIPQYDVYINRWSSILNNKKLLKETLQLWRIHHSNSSNSSEMISSKIESLFSRYWNKRNDRPINTYIQNISQYKLMLLELNIKQRQLSRLPLASSANDITKILNAIIVANAHRRDLVKGRFFLKLKIISIMVFRNYYKYFKGWKSFMKDVSGII